MPYQHIHTHTWLVLCATSVAWEKRRDREDYSFLRQVYEKQNIIPGCLGSACWSDSECCPPARHSCRSCRDFVPACFARCLMSRWVWVPPWTQLHCQLTCRRVNLLNVRRINTESKNHQKDDINNDQYQNATCSWPAVGWIFSMSEQSTRKAKTIRKMILMMINQKKVICFWPATGWTLSMSEKSIQNKPIMSRRSCNQW